MKDRLRAILNGRGLAWGLALAFAVLPFAFDKSFGDSTMSTVMLMLVYLILALGLNVVVGFTGLLDLGYVVFMATGAIVTVVLAGMRSGPEGIDWPVGTDAEITGDLVFGFDGSILVILLLAGVACAVLGIIRGIPTLRVRGDYFAIVTLGFAEIMYETALWDESRLVHVTRVTGGAFGAKIASADYPRLFGEPLRYRTPHYYYLLLALVVLTFVVCHNLNRSRTGRSFAAIRLDETAARACGVDVARTKLIAFAVSGFIGGVGGGMFALWSQTVAVKNLDVWVSIIILCCIVLGGMGSLRGVALGTMVLVPLGEVLRGEVGGVSIPPEARFLVYGFLLILVMRFRPQGMLPPDRRETPLTDDRKAALRSLPSSLYALDEREAGS